MQRAHRCSRRSPRGSRAAARCALRAAPAAAPPRLASTCSTRRRARARSPRARLLNGLAPGRQAHRRGRPARPRVCSRRRRQDLAAGRGAGQLRPDRGVTSRRRRTAGPSATTAWCCTAPTAARTWTRQLDGRRAKASVLVDALRAQRRRRPKRAAARGSRSASRRRAPRTRSSTSGSTTRTNGFVVGAFNLILRTADGGKTWEPLAARDRQPEGSAPVRHPRHRRRAVHRRRAGSGAASSTATAAASRALDAAVQGHAVRRGRQRSAPCSCYGLRGNVVAQHRRRPQLAERSTPACSVGLTASTRRRATAASSSSARPGTCSSAATTARRFAPLPGRATDAGRRGGRAPATARSCVAGPRGVAAPSRCA